MKKTAKQYIFSKGLFFYGIPTAVLCLIIFTFTVKGDFNLTAIANDLPLGAFITIFICTASCIPGIKADVKKGTVGDLTLTKREHPVYRKLPNNLILQALIFSLIGTAVFTLIPIGFFTSFFPGILIKKTTYVIVKSLYTGLYINIIIRHVATYNIGQVQNKYNLQVD